MKKSTTIDGFGSAPVVDPPGNNRRVGKNLGPLLHRPPVGTARRCNFPLQNAPDTPQRHKGLGRIDVSEHVMAGSTQTNNKSLVFLAAVALVAVGSRAAAGDAPSTGGPAVDYHKDIEPIFKSHCLRCHGPDKRKGGLLLTTRKYALVPADSGLAVLVPGDSKKSTLLHRVQSAAKDQRMPPSGPPLTPEQITL